jgi:hypothetical protein
MKKSQLNKEAMLYQSLGHLSIRFAHLEKLLKELLVQLITQKAVDTLIGRIMVDDFTLSKTLQYLHKILRRDRSTEEKIKPVLKIIESVRNDRNYFVHGLWKEPKLNKKTNEIEIICGSKKLKYKETDESRTWTSLSEKRFTLDNIHSCREKVDKAIPKIQTVLDEIEETGPLYFY